MTSALEKGTALVARLGKSYESKVKTLRDADALTQDSLLKAFQQTLSEHRTDFQDTLCFQSNVSKCFYELVNITAEPTNFTQGEKEYSFHPRLLLWNGLRSSNHTHPADGRLAEGDISCVYYPLSDASDVRYTLVEEGKGTVKSIVSLAAGDVGVDYFSATLERRLAHSFVPPDTALENIRVTTEDGWEQPVYAITVNLYNAAQPSQPAASQLVEDMDESLTTQGLERLKHYQKQSFLQNDRVVLEVSSEGTFLPSFTLPQQHPRLRALREQGTMDDIRWTTRIQKQESQVKALSRAISH